MLGLDKFAQVIRCTRGERGKITNSKLQNRLVNILEGSDRWFIGFSGKRTFNNPHLNNKVELFEDLRILKTVKRVILARHLESLQHGRGSEFYDHYSIKMFKKRF